MSERWVPEPETRDGAEGRGESGPASELSTRRETEEAAESGRFPAGDELRDDSSPVEPVEDRAARSSDPTS